MESQVCVQCGSGQAQAGGPVVAWAVAHASVPSVLPLCGLSGAVLVSCVGGGSIVLGYGGWVVGSVGRVGCVPGAAGVCGAVQVSCGGVGWVQGGWVVLAFGSRGWGSVGSVRV